MSRIRNVLAAISVITALYGAPSLAEDDAASSVSTAKDLTAVIALQGLACGQVVGVSQQGENDYIATCKDGNRYRVTVNADGRVVVTKVK